MRPCSKCNGQMIPDRLGGGYECLQCGYWSGPVQLTMVQAMAEAAERGRTEPTEAKLRASRINSRKNTSAERLAQERERSLRWEESHDRELIAENIRRARFMLPPLAVLPTIAEAE